MLPTDVFAKIISGELSADIVLETDRMIAFRDIAPKAKTHVVIVPKENLVTAKEVTEKNLNLFGELFLMAKKEIGRASCRERV